jgi:hypothetical protein
MELAERALVVGDLAELTPNQRAHYYVRVCESLGLNQCEAVRFPGEQVDNPGHSGRGQAGVRDRLERLPQDELPGLRGVWACPVGPDESARTTVSHLHQQADSRPAPVAIGAPARRRESDVERWGSSRREDGSIRLRVGGQGRSTSSHGEQERLRDAASPRHGSVPGSPPSSPRAGPPQERRPEGQPDRELGAVEAVPALGCAAVGLPLPRLPVRRGGA